MEHCQRAAQGSSPPPSPLCCVGCVQCVERRRGSAHREGGFHPGDGEAAAHVLCGIAQGASAYTHRAHLLHHAPPLTSMQPHPSPLPLQGRASAAGRGRAAATRRARASMGSTAARTQPHSARTAPPLPSPHADASFRADACAWLLRCPRCAGVAVCRVRVAAISRCSAWPLLASAPRRPSLTPPLMERRSRWQLNAATPNSSHAALTAVRGSQGTRSVAAATSNSPLTLALLLCSSSSLL